MKKYRMWITENEDTVDEYPSKCLIDAIEGRNIREAEKELRASAIREFKETYNCDVSVGVIKESKVEEYNFKMNCIVYDKSRFSNRRFPLYIQEVDI